MHGKEPEGHHLYACSYRISYGDKAAAAALGHGKWQYVREDMLLELIDGFFAHNIFGPERIAHFQAQHVELARDIDATGSDRPDRLRRKLDEIDHKIALQVRAIEAGVDPNLVRDRIAALKTQRAEIDTELAALQPTQPNGSINLDEAREILNALPDLGKALSTADTETRRGVFDAFRLSVALDRNAHQIQVKALVSSAFTKARDLQSLVTNGAIAGAGFEPATSGL